MWGGAIRSNPVWWSGLQTLATTDQKGQGRKRIHRIVGKEIYSLNGAGSVRKSARGAGLFKPSKHDACPTYAVSLAVVSVRLWR